MMARSLISKPPQASQKAVKPLPAKVGLQPSKAVAPKSAPKTKKAKSPSKVSGKKITGHNKKLKAKGAPLKKKAVKGLVRSVK